MPDSHLLTQIEAAFKDKSWIKTSKDFAVIIGENPNGLSDIKAGRKKLTVDHIKNLKNSHPTFNVDWLLTDGNGPMFIEQEDATDTSELSWLAPFNVLKDQLAKLRMEHEELKRRVSGIEKKKAGVTG